MTGRCSHCGAPRVTVVQRGFHTAEVDPRNDRRTLPAPPYLICAGCWSWWRGWLSQYAPLHPDRAVSSFPGGNP